MRASRLGRLLVACAAVAAVGFGVAASSLASPSHPGGNTVVHSRGLSSPAGDLQPNEIIWT